MLIHLFYIHADIEWSKQQGKIKMAMCLGESIGLLAVCCDVIVTQKCKPAISFLKLRRGMALRVAEVLCATGGEEV